MYQPAMHAVIKLATFPVIIDPNASLARVDFFVGIKVLKTPRTIPIEPKFENPQTAYVVITMDLSLNKIKI